MDTLSSAAVGCAIEACTRRERPGTAAETMAADRNTVAALKRFFFNSISFPRVNVCASFKMEILPERKRFR